ncbi:oligosaccharide repeat unit polymerase [Saccharibacillus sp. O23]|uniref:O-antigen polymerase n=1 Tax=Saccharibacillus sp. O23 TaxID=2009338 RepID=UPI000B4DFC8E|nr:O-antigen polymerase [Saccharibacillus sp. O23]OWR26791.1 oligosaccharide repeat unit polymerase [Saccharibacillus sp. O23]
MGSLRKNKAENRNKAIPGPESTSGNMRIWWLNPTIVFPILMTVILIGAYYIPSDSYVSFYRVNKFISESNIMYSILPVCCFVLGGILASLAGRGTKSSKAFGEVIVKRDSFIKMWINLLFGFTMFGYAVWFLIMLRSGFSLGLFLNVLSGEPGAIYSIKENFNNVAGVTSFTNFSIPFVILTSYYLFYNKKKIYIWMLAIVFVFTMLRAVFFLERLAIMEFIVPLAVVYFSMRAKLGRRPRFLAIYPIVGVVALIGFFGASEYFRSWLSYYVNYYPSFWEFIITRFFGYYVTAINTGTLYMEHLGFHWLPFPSSTAEFIWKFPGVPDNAYESIYGFEPQAVINNTLATMGNPEFNNPSGLLQPYNDYGFSGALVFWVIVGFFTGVLYNHFKKGHTFGMMIYPIWLVGVLEIPRYFYFGSGRFFPCWIIILAFTFILHYNRKKLTTWRLRGVGADE